jgi:hypothetical protein
MFGIIFLLLWITFPFQFKQLYMPNKLFELTEQICIHVEQIIQIKTKYLYIPNKCCEMTKHIIKEEKIFTEKTNMLEGISI